MKIFYTKKEVSTYLSEVKANNKTIGFVPTMGALHQGHLSLIKKAQQKNDIVVVSIFVNPTQFDNKEDLIKYPKTTAKDISLLETINCNVLFLPSVAEIYSNTIKSKTFHFDGLETKMEGKFRDGHFNGVGTIITYLFDIVKPNNAYFGKKDYQQYLIIKKLVEKNNSPVIIKGCAIFREPDGLAMSSRNARLSKAHRAAAPFIYKTLKKVQKKFKQTEVSKINKWVIKQFKKHPLLTLEYFTIADTKTLETAKIKDSSKKYRAFIAVFAGDIRLIDNISLKNK